MLITPEYLALNRSFHEAGGFRGGINKYWATIAVQLMNALHTQDILEYGCGNAPFGNMLTFPIQEYDPAVPRYSATPHPADLVITGCLLAHIEPECLNDVLADIRRCTKRTAFFVIAHEEAAEDVLADGRNAHLITQPWAWWKDKLVEHGFTLQGAHTIPIVITPNPYTRYTKNKTFVVVGGDNPAQVELAKETENVWNQSPTA